MKLWWERKRRRAGLVSGSDAGGAGGMLNTSGDYGDADGDDEHLLFRRLTAPRVALPPQRRPATVSAVASDRARSSTWDQLAGDPEALRLREKWESRWQEF